MDSVTLPARLLLKSFPFWIANDSSQNEFKTMTVTSHSKGHAYAWLFSLILLLLLCACNSKADSDASPREALIMPVQLEADSTWIQLNDYTSWVETVDSILWEDGSFIETTDHPVTGSPAILIKQQPYYALGHINLYSKGKSIDIPLIKTSKRNIRVSLAITEEIKEARLMGSFTSWQSNSIEMVSDGDSLHAYVTLDVGSHLYQFIANGNEFPDPSNPNQMANGFGGFNSILKVGNPSASLPLSTSFDGQFSCSSDPQAAYAVYYNNEMIEHGQANALGHFTFNIPHDASRVGRSHIRIWVANEDELGQNALIPLHQGIPIKEPGTLNRHDRQSMVMYFMMLDRFKNGDPTNDWKSNDPGVHPSANHMGGDLRGLQQAIPYLDSLGINTVWISPVTPNPDEAWGFWSDPSTEVTSKFSSYHGYWPIASSGIDRRFGDMKAFHTVVDAIHEKDMNVLIDYVANHVHQDHPVYQNHPDWATNLYLPDGSLNTQLWDDQRLTTWFDTFMPTLDLERKEVYETMTDSALWWVKNTQIDGFRHDATKHIPEVFWRRLTEKVRAETMDSNRSLFQIGETYGPPSLIKKYVSSGMLDAQFDFNLYDAYVAAFTSDEPDLAGLISIAEQSLKAYGPHHLMGNITGNQDRPRFSSLADGSLRPGEDSKLAGWSREIRHNGQRGYKRMQWLMASLMSQSGIPCIYFGDEIADAGGNDPDNRRMMRFSNWNESERETWDMTKEWITLRKSRMSLMYGQSSYSTNDSAPGLLAIERTYLEEKTITLINTTSKEKRFPILEGTQPTLLTGCATLERNAIVLPPTACAALDIAPNF